MRRYKRRCRIEHVVARLKVFRRLRVRYDYRAAKFGAFVHVGCLPLLLREFV